MPLNIGRAVKYNSSSNSPVLNIQLHAVSDLELCASGRAASL